MPAHDHQRNRPASVRLRRRVTASDFARQTAERPLRILAVTNQYPHDGGWRGINVKEHVDDLRALGHHVDIELVVQGRSRADYLLRSRHVARRAGAGDYDVVHTHFGMTGVTTRLVRAVPKVLTLYGSDINETWKRWITRVGWGETAARIYVSERLRKTAGDADGIVIPNGVNLELFRTGDREAARRRLGFGHDEKVVMFGSDPTIGVKDHDMFSQVMRELKRTGVPATEMVLAAPRQSRAEIVAKFEAADLLLFTSRQGSEGSPTVVKEAAVMGLPVVSVDVGDVAEMLAGVSPSAVVDFPSKEAGDPRVELVKRLATAAGAVLEKRRRSDGRESRQWLDSARIAQRVVAVYRAVIPVAP